MAFLWILLERPNQVSLIKFYVGPGDATYNHDFVFEAMGYKWLYIHLCDGDDNSASCYMAAFSDKKSTIKKNNENMIFKSLSTSHWMSLKTNSFTNFRIKLELTDSKLSLEVGSGY